MFWKSFYYTGFMAEKYINRQQYLDELISYKDDDIIKVITGIRRSGKSTLLFEIYSDWLLENGVNEEQIIKIDLELKSNEHLCNEDALYEYIKNKLAKGKKNYVFIDEVQNCKGFEKVVGSLHKEKVDVYITGSNAYMLSGELRTFITGRYIEIEMLPLSFKEYVSCNNKITPEEMASMGRDYLRHGISPKKVMLEGLYKDYVKFGAFPKIATYKNDSKKIDTYLDGIYDSVFKKDIIDRNKISSVATFETVMKYVLANIGSPISAKSISDYLISTNKKVYPITVDEFLRYLVESYIVYKAERFDVKSKEMLKSLGKYYATDIGLRNYLLGYRDEMDKGHVLENVIYFELLRRGYKVFIGKVDNKEVDFVAMRRNETLYIQVAQTVVSEDTLKRELSPFYNIKDFHQRILITMDVDINDSYKGIKHINALDFLMQDV